MFARTPLAASLALALFAHTAAGFQCPPTLDKVAVASDPESGSEFGHSVSLSGDTLLVGAPLKNDNFLTDAGAAYVYVRSGTDWIEQAKLQAPAPEVRDEFGYSVSIDGETAVVGAREHELGSSYGNGAAYVFVRSGTSWSLQATLTASNGKLEDRFGEAVSISGDTILVGAPGFQHGGMDAGAAYVFTRSGTSWTEQRYFAVSSGPTSPNFGSAVCIEGDRAAIGSILHSFTGAVFIYERTGTSWSSAVEVTASDKQGFSYFGAALDLDGDALLVGARLHSNTGFSKDGSAYYFTYDGQRWVEQAKLVPSVQANLDEFGQAVALDGDQLAVSSRLGDPGGTVNVFQRVGGQWIDVVQVAPAGSMNSSGTTGFFGYSVAFKGQDLIGGAPSDKAPGGGLNSGTAFIYRFEDPLSFYCSAGTSAAGCQASLSATGVASASATSGFSLSATGVEGGKDGLFFFGTNGRQQAPWGNGTSFQCVVPPVSRAGLLQGSGSAGSCDAVFTQDLNALWCSTCPGASKNPGAAAVVQAQLWYRDPFNTSNQTTSLSNAIEFCLAP